MGCGNHTHISGTRVVHMVSSRELSLFGRAGLFALCVTLCLLYMLFLVCLLYMLLLVCLLSVLFLVCLLYVLFLVIR